MSTNYQKIKLSKEVTEYREAVDLELTDAVPVGKSGVPHLSSGNISNGYGGSNYGSQTRIFT